MGSQLVKQLPTILFDSAGKVWPLASKFFGATVVAHKLMNINLFHSVWRRCSQFLLDAAAPVTHLPAMVTKALPPKFLKIMLTFEKREDGGLRVHSDDVPGFVLSHSDCDLVFADIEPALQTILSARFNADVVVGPLHELRDELEWNGFIAANHAVARHQPYVVHVAH